MQQGKARGPDRVGMSFAVLQNRIIIIDTHGLIPPKYTFFF